MSQDQEHFALDWIKGDLLETLDGARAALEAYSEEGADQTRMRACLTALHQVHGTLVMLELPGIGLLADHMEQLAQALMGDGVAEADEAIAHLMQGVLELPGYLEAIQAGQGDSTRPVIPLVNEIRAHLNQEPLELPPVNVLAGYASDAAVAKFQGIQGLEKVRKVRSAYQQVLLSILKGEDRAAAVGTLKKISQGLIRICDDTPHEGQWQAFAEFIESLDRQSGPLDAEAIKLLRRVDAELRMLATQGASALQKPVNRELVQALLQQAEEREHQSDRLAGLKEAVQEKAPVDSLAISGRQALASAALALREDVSELKDRIDLDVRGQKTDRESFSALLPPLTQIGNTLSLLGFQSSNATVFDQVDAINDCLRSQEFDVATLAGIADALIKVDENLASATQGMRGKGEVERITSDAQRAVAREARTALETVKDAIVAYVSSGWEYAKLTEMPAIIDEACGALDMIPLARPARQLGECRRYIVEVLPHEQPDWNTLDQLADAISGVDYYLERTIEQSSASAEGVLDLVDRSLDALDFGRAEQRVETPAEDHAEATVEVETPEEHSVVVEPTPTQAVLIPGSVQSPESEPKAEDIAESDVEAAADAEEPKAFEPEALLDVEAVFAAESARAGLDDDFDLGDDEFEALDELDEALPPADAAAAPEAHSSTVTRDAAVSAIAAAAVGGAVAGLADAHQEDDEIAEIFLEEAGEVLDQVDHWLPEWRKELAQEEALGELRRAFHTLKGSGRMVGANVLGELAWSVENMLNRVIDQTVTPNDQFVQVCSDVRALAPSLMQAFEQQAQPDLAPVGVLIEAADLLASGGSLEETAAAIEAATETVDDSGAGSAASELLLDESMQIFIDEAREHLAVLQSALASDHFDPSEEAVRALHTLAGSAGIAGADSLAKVARPAYELGRGLRTQQSVPAATDADAAAFLGRYLDALDRYLTRISQGAEIDFDDQLAVEAEQLLDQLSSDNSSHQLLSVEGLGTLFEASEYVNQWHGGAQDLGFAEQLDETLGRLATQARTLDYDDLAATADQLASTHRHLNDLALEASAAAELTTAHELLLQHIDALVAEQDAPALASIRAALSALEAAPEGVVEEPVSADESAAEPAVESEEAHGTEAAADAPADSEEAELSLEDDEYDLAQLKVDETPQPTVPSAPTAVPTPADRSEPAEPARVANAASAASAASAADAEFDMEILEIFGEEADEILESLDETIHALDLERDNHLHVETLLRDLHTMKGGARLASLTALGDLTHDFESEVLARQSDGQAADDAFVELLHQRHDALLTMVGSVKQTLDVGGAGIAASAAVVGLQAAAEAATTDDADHAEDAADSAAIGEAEQAEAVDRVAESEQEAVDAVADATVDDELLVASAANESLTDLTALELDADVDNVVPLMQVANGPKLKPPALKPQAPSRAAGDGGNQEMVRVGAQLLEALVNLAGESSIMRGRIEQGLGDFTVALDEMETTIGRVREQLRRLEIETEAQILFRQERFDSPSYEGFDPLEMDRYSQLQQLSRSLSESASDMLDLKETLLFKARESETLLLQQARINTELQEGLMRTRMVPFSRLLPRLRRTVRQVAGELGKEVDFSAFNAEGELDRNLLDRMIPPLEHMLRNAVDHGIETPSERRNFNKRETGQIELRLGREGGDVLIEISDDGAGIDYESVREKAIERGLMQPDADLRDDEILQFVLAPGFSTAKSVTQISGRGVGMDVVHSEVKQLGGSISIASKPGEGTRFSLRVPFTVSVNRALMVSVGDDLYAIPLNTIEGIVLLGPQELDKLYAADAGPFEYAGVSYQVRYLGHFLGREYRGNSGQASAPVVLVRAGDQAIAVHVDAVQGSREIVVKSLGPQFAGVGGISGATILGDGSVVVILDLLALIRSRSELPRAPSRRPSAHDNRARCVMVVDDSVTVRKVTSRLLERQGMDVIVAKDGVEAVAMLQERRPDILLLDIEMPRMDGFEVARQVRHDDHLEGLPIVMISSRTGEKHQDRAANLGVNRFLGKPFQESELLETIDELVQS